jgi:hypothetical protein
MRLSSNCFYSRELLVALEKERGSYRNPSGDPKQERCSRLVSSRIAFRLSLEREASESLTVAYVTSSLSVCTYRRERGRRGRGGIFPASEPPTGCGSGAQMRIAPAVPPYTSSERQSVGSVERST